ncbi:D-2-hydroxyacid dehydrogenase [Veronia pacifica]|uniref:2-ketoacid reductase n=1 Tax=Veronia pacifica TaxID=1080227 RepID=A0A1C3ECN9_9GAMM|nr:D-2-hydroxyacid dehydrogenase [Veronia pacifica]ODA31008.1 2-ketoacid reductase [Veronia pacifica]
MNLLFIDSDQKAKYQALLSVSSLPDLQITPNISEANIILADPPAIADKLEQATSLVWLQSTYAGCDALIEQNKRDYRLSNVRGIFGALISEYVLGQLLNMTRHFSVYKEQQQHKQWQPHAYRSLNGQRILILGTGSIGRQLAVVARQFGMKVSGVSRSGTQLPAFDHVFDTSSLGNALADTDIVVSTLPSTPSTISLLDADTLSHCRQVILFNVGRGNVLCEEGLKIALTKGQISHAFLDVFEQEPLADDHWCWQHPDVTVTPHIAAVSFPEQVAECFRQNYLSWHQEDKLLTEIDFSRGY